ncbi:MAG: argininosuccinate lyase [bacterium]|nr:argininosuccinate lyase [bacterium]
MSNLRNEIIENDGTEFPGKSFAKNILKPIFEIQKEHYLKHFIDITKAHVIMLNEQKILTDAEKLSIFKGLKEVEEKDLDSIQYNPKIEDLFFNIEKMLENLIGKDLAGKIHTARSRNDICIAEFRLRLREKLIELFGYINEFRELFLVLIEDHIDTIIPAYTHTQPAQPTTLAHYLLSFYDSLTRDYKRFEKAYSAINRSPLGAVAITTTGFNISRERVCELLGFDELVENSYDCIAGSDYMTEFASVLMIMNTNLSKFIKDTLDQCTNEFSGFYLADPYVQISSIMPQKRNPSSLEHCRPIIGKAIGEAKIVFEVQYNSPYGDIVDSEEELQEHIYSSIDFTIRALDVIKNVFASLKINKELLFDRCTKNFITVTELADTLVREYGLSFRKSHHITSQIVKYLHKNNLTSDAITSEIIKPILDENVDFDIDISDEIVKNALDPRNFVNKRKIIGGPAPQETTRMLKNRRLAFKQDIESLKSKINKINQVDINLKQ